MNDQDVRLSELTEIILMHDAENSSERGTYYYASKLASMLMKRLDIDLSGKDAVIKILREDIAFYKNNWKRVQI